MTTPDDILDATQQLVLESGRRPSLQTVARAVGLTKQGVLHHFPDRAALDGALVARAVARVDALMQEAVSGGRCAETYLRLATPTDADRAAVGVVLGSADRDTLVDPEVIATIGSWEAMIAEELGDPVRAEIVRLVSDGLFAESLLTGQAPSIERVDRLVAFLLEDERTS